MTNVYTVFVESGIYTKEWVYRMKKSLERNSTVPFDFFCLTDRSLPGIETIELKNPTLPWLKMELCNPDIQGRIHYLDLGTLITGNIDFFLKEDESLMQRDASAFILDKDERRMVWEFWTNDTKPHVTNFDRSSKIYDFILGGQIETIQKKHPGKVFSWDDERSDSLNKGCKILTFPGKQKVSSFDDGHWIKKYW